jgi:hypothetical protein
MDMETARKKGLTPIQKQMFFQMYLVMAVGWAVSALLHQPVLIIGFLLAGWTVSIFVFTDRPIGYWNIVRGVAAMGASVYLFYRFVSPWIFR